MEAEYGIYEYDKLKFMEKDHTNFWYRWSKCLLTFEISRMICKKANKNEPIIPN